MANEINRNLQERKYCSAVFLDISQAFDKVWHVGLKYKLKKELPYHIYEIINSYLSNRSFVVKCLDEKSPVCLAKSGVPQGSVLGPVLYLIYTADLPTTNNSICATFADDTVIMASHENPDKASIYLQENLNKIQDWLQIWRIKANESKSVHVTFTMKRKTCPPVKLNNTQIPQADVAKYLGMHLDRRLTWKTHIWNKRKQLGLTMRKYYWIMSRTSQLTTENKLLVYKSIVKPIWMYGIQLWGSASDSNIEIIQRFQSKTLRMIVNAPWFVQNAEIHKDTKMKTVKEEIENARARYKDRLKNHPNQLAKELVKNKNVGRLKRKVIDL